MQEGVKDKKAMQERTRESQNKKDVQERFRLKSKLWKRGSESIEAKQKVKKLCKRGSKSESCTSEGQSQKAMQERVKVKKLCMRGSKSKSFALQERVSQKAMQ